MNVETQRLGITPFGVNSQYCGNSGTVENYQADVFMAYVTNGFRLLPDFRQYLPGIRTKNPSRCDAAGIPPEFQCFKTKAELVYELICQVIEAKIKFSFVAMDCFMENTLGYYPALRTKESRMCPTLFVKIA